MPILPFRLRVIRLVAAVLLLCGTGAIGRPAAAPGGNDARYLQQKVKEWQTAVSQHEPGKPDPAAVLIGQWESFDLEAVIKYISKLASQPPSSAKRTLSRGEIRRLLDLTDQEVKQGDLSRILKKGALLHTDIALLELGKGGYQIKPQGFEGIGIFADGRVLFQPLNFHWQFARQLIDLISRSPSQDKVIRTWYIATTAHMQNSRLLGYAGQNLKHAMEKFPSDGRLMFYAGVLHETWGSPVSQNSLLPRGVKVSYGSTESELKQARGFLEKALVENPGLAEARLRLGRVLGLLGHHKRAVTELQNAAAAIRDPQLSYYVSLFLGHEFTMLVRRNEAREHYERAAMLYPTAQSPLLALSQLAHDSGDVEGALHALQGVFALRVTDRWNDDPWWVYDLAHVRDASVLVSEMRRMLGELP